MMGLRKTIISNMFIKIKNILLILFTGLFFLSLQAGKDTLTIEEKTQKADLVFEGKIIKDSAFWGYNKMMIYSLKYVLLAKEFKGEFNSDTIIIVVEGGRVDGQEFTVADGGFPQLPLNSGGIFFCKR